MSRRGVEALWSTTDYLLAAVLDALNAANWQRAAAGAKKKPPRPKPVPRPADMSRRRRSKLAPDETRRRLEALYARDAKRKKAVTDGS